MQKTITIRDVAKRASVGISTVSRVVNGGAGVNEATRERVRAVIAECGYAPNNNARQLKQRHADAAAVIVRGAGSMFLASVLELLQSRIEALGLRFLAHYIDEHDDEAAAARAIHAEKKVRGIVLLGGSVVGREDKLDLPNVPCVYATLDARTVRAKNVFSVSVDDRAAAYAATDYLLARGHRNIAVLGGRLDAENPIALRFIFPLSSRKRLLLARLIPLGSTPGTRPHCCTPIFKAYALFLYPNCLQAERRCSHSCSMNRYSRSHTKHRLTRSRCCSTDTPHECI